jgi:flagellar hook-basal body complex protein FliE
MDPLSAYRMAVGPMGGAMPMPMSPEQTIGKIIPQNELDQLSSASFRPITNAETALARVGGSAGVGGMGNFGEMVNQVNAKQAEATEAMRDVMSGGPTPLHQAMIAVEEASVSFQLMVEVRNRLLESYQELMRMQV